MSFVFMNSLFSLTGFRAILFAVIILCVEGKDGFAVLHFGGKNGNLGVGRLDPIVFPGKTAGHVHMFQGSNGIVNGKINIDKATCTTSTVKADKSIYWTPQLLFNGHNGTVEVVKMDYMNVYYFFDEQETIKPFPKGLRMIAGNMGLREPPTTGGQLIIDHKDGPIQPVQWTCPRKSESATWPANSDGKHGAGIVSAHNTGAGVVFPDTDCDGMYSPMRADIHFPSCYNPAVNPEDYKNPNQMAYPTNGACPAGYYRVPRLFYEVYWNTMDFSGKWKTGEGSQPWVLSQGDPTGYGLHGDFVNGWDLDALQTIARTCDAGDSAMDKCSEIPGGLSTDEEMNCQIDFAEMMKTSETWTNKAGYVLNGIPGDIEISKWGSANIVMSMSNSTTKAEAASAVTNTNDDSTGGTATATLDISSSQDTSIADDPVSSYVVASAAPTRAACRRAH